MRPATAIQALREILHHRDGNFVVAHQKTAAVEEPVDLVRRHVAAVLGYDSPAEVQSTRTFEDLGFDSISVVELRDRLSAATGRKLPTSMVYDHPTPQKLAGFLRAAQGPDTVDSVLDRLEQLITALPAAEGGQVGARLRELAAGLTPRTSVVDISGRLQVASAEDVLHFIDKELGLA
jgi:acyl carrier protein